MGFLSKMFGKKENPMDEVFRKIAQVLEDEEYQNSLTPIGPIIESMPSVDKLPDATGEFGFENSNPIPVNGPIGEMAYLSRLETNQGESLLFHRIGAIDKIDVFEGVTFSGSAWYIFFLDYYHPRRSRLAPKGFRIADKPKQFSGFHNYCENFPYDFPEKKEKDESGFSLAYIALSSIADQISQKAYQRPVTHKAKIDIVKGLLTSYQK